MISCPTTSVLLLALLAATLLPRVAFSSASAVDDKKKYNGICDVDICTCFTYDGTACPDWMMNRGGSGSLSVGNVTKDARQPFACSAGSLLEFSGVPHYSYWSEVSSDKTESPMHFLHGISMEYWVEGVGERNTENSTVLVNYTASDPAPDCSTLTPPAEWSSSSVQSSTIRMSLVTASGSAIVAVVATFL